MSLYDAAKDALKLAQKADNAELVQKILDVQSQALEMQEKQFELHKTVDEQRHEIESLKEKKKYAYEEGHSWCIDPSRPDLRLCPVCLNRDNFENPMQRNGTEGYCGTCRKSFT